MASIVITVPEDQVDLVSDAFVHKFVYMLPPLDEDETRTPEEDRQLMVDFTKSRISDYIQDVVRQHLAYLHQQKAEIPEAPINLT